MSEIISTYKTIKNTSKGYFRDRGSKFFGYAYPIQSPAEVKEIIKNLKKENPKAVHHCFAYRIGTEGLQFRANDDGEPSGSAGQPILGQIDSAGLTDILIVVVRYFGGQLLGVPGLINAYKTTAVACIEEAEIVEKNIEHIVELSFNYPTMNEVMQVLKQYEVNIIHQEMLLFCKIKIGIPILSKEVCLKKLNQILDLEINEIDS